MYWIFSGFFRMIRTMGKTAMMVSLWKITLLATMLVSMAVVISVLLYRFKRIFAAVTALTAMVKIMMDRWRLCVVVKVF